MGPRQVRILTLAVTAAIVSLLLLSPVSGCRKKSEKPTKKETTTEELRETIAAETGQYFEVFLESNPTTGYKWNTVQAPDENVVKLTGSGFIAPSGEKKLGAPGQEIFRFLAVGPGSTTVMLEYTRGWEKDKPPAKRYMLTANVTQADRQITSAITVVAGQEFDLTVDTEPAAGFSWVLAKKPDENTFKPLSSDVTPGEAVGAPAKQNWKFLAVNQGNTSLVLEYRGPGETSSFEKRHTINVTVTPAPSKPSSTGGKSK